MKIQHLILTIILAVACSIATVRYVDSNRDTNRVTETAYERVKRTSVIRCGYGIWSGLFEKDPRTGTFSGTAYEYTNALAERLSLKVIWAEEIGWADIIPALRSRRVDAFCSGLWTNSGRAREIDFVRPVYYNAIYAYARANDKRFDNNLALANIKTRKIVVIDGTTVSLIQKQDFPDADVLSLPESNSNADLFESVAAGKADLTFADPAAAGAYMENNPGKIRRIETSGPIRSFALGIAIPSGEYEFKRMFDIVTEELLSAGVIETIIRKYEKYPGSYLRVHEGYKQ